MQDVTSITINSVNYFSADELKNLYPQKFIGARTTREYIKKRKVPNDQYIFARQVNGEWRESDGNSNRVDKVFLRQDHVEDNFASLGETRGVDDATSRSRSKSDYTLSGAEHTAPIILAEEEMFRDDDGDVYEVDVRGQRHEDKCYFRVRDIEKVFEMKNLNKTITDSRWGYKKGEDYVLLVLSSDNPSISDRQQVKPRNNKRTTFFTYSGLLHVIYSSKSGNARKFSKWATKIVYTAHMGTKPQRQKAAASMIGTSARNVKAVFDKSVTGLAFVYLLRLGPVSQFRKKLSIGLEYGDNDTLYKFGRTDDLGRRMREHNKKYRAECAVEYYINIDPKHTAEAESFFARYIKGLKIHYSHERYNELCIIPADESKIILGQIKDNMAQMSKAYIGSLAAIQADKDKIIAEYEKRLREQSQELHAHYQAKLDKKDEIIQAKDEIIQAKDGQHAQERADLMLMINEGRVVARHEK